MAYIYDLTDTWNAGGTTFNAIKMNVTDSASAAGSKLVTLQTNGTEHFSVTKAGVGYFSGNVGIGTASPLGKLDVDSATGQVGFNAGVSSSPERGNLWYDTDGSGWKFNIGKLQGGSFTPQMTFQDNGNVGIGTSSPSTILHVAGSSVTEVRVTSSGNLTTGAASLLRFGGSNSATSGYIGYGGTASTIDLWNNLAGSLTFGTSNLERMRITSAGNVGIGTSSPGAKLALSTSTNDGILIDAPMSIAAYAEVRARYTGQNNCQSAIRFYNPDNGYGGAFTIWTQPESNGAAMVERMRIDSSGNVGIGVTPSASNLATIQSTYGIISGNSQINIAQNAYYSSGWKYTGSAAASLYFQGSGAHNWQIASSGTAGNAISFTQAMTLDSSGNLLVGTTSATFNAAGYRVSPSGSGGSVNVNISNTGGGVPLSLNTTADAGIVQFYRSSTLVGTISVTTTATAYNTSSDYRLKDIDGPITNSGAYIDALKPVQGSWKADGSRFIGLLAHEVQEVSETPIATGEKDGEEMQAMDYSAPEIIANLIAEIQSLRARVAQLEGN